MEEQCSKTCKRLPDNPPSSLKFCTSSITYSICPTEDSWGLQQENLSDLITSIGIPMDDVYEHLKLVDEPTRQQDIDYHCALTLQKLTCQLTYPACEIGKEIRNVCVSSCTELLLTCRDSTLIIPTSFCKDVGFSDGKTYTTKNPERDDKNCTTLDYEGANHLLWIAGFFIAFMFSFLAALGLNLQKLSMSREELILPKSTRRPPMKQPIWVIGLTLITAGSLLDFVAFGLAPQSLLAPLGALSLCWNLLIAPLFHSEKITR